MLRNPLASNSLVYYKRLKQASQLHFSQKAGWYDQLLALEEALDQIREDPDHGVLRVDELLRKLVQDSRKATLAEHCNLFWYCAASRFGRFIVE